MERKERELLRKGGSDGGVGIGERERGMKEPQPHPSLPSSNTHTHSFEPERRLLTLAAVLDAKIFVLESIPVHRFPARAVAHRKVTALDLE
jgi:hypothetical protein